MSELAKYFDLLITDGNFTLNAGNEPELCKNRRSISQDCVHAIIESGLAKELIAERSPTLRADILMRMELLLETDERLIPGTVSIKRIDAKDYLIEAETYDFGMISMREQINA